MGKYENVKLAHKRRRVKNGKFIEIEKKLVEFLEERKNSGIKNDLSWIVLAEKALELSKEVPLPPHLEGTFKASAGWLYGVLHRNGFIHVDLSGNDNSSNSSNAPGLSLSSSSTGPKPMSQPQTLPLPQPPIVLSGDITMV